MENNKTMVADQSDIRSKCRQAREELTVIQKDLLKMKFCISNIYTNYGLNQYDYFDNQLHSFEDKLNLALADVSIIMESCLELECHQEIYT